MARTLSPLRVGLPEPGTSPVSADGLVERIVGLLPRRPVLPVPVASGRSGSDLFETVRRGFSRRRFELAFVPLDRVPLRLPAPLQIAAVPERTCGKPLFVGRTSTDPARLPDRSLVETVGDEVFLVQLKRRFPHLRFTLRDHAIGGSLEKLRRPGGKTAGCFLSSDRFLPLKDPLPPELHRINLEERAFLPSAGSDVGSLVLPEKSPFFDVLRSLNHEPTWSAVLAERRLAGLIAPEGIPLLAVRGEPETDICRPLLHLQARAYPPDGTSPIEETVMGDLEVPLETAESLATMIRARDEKGVLESGESGRKKRRKRNCRTAARPKTARPRPVRSRGRKIR